MVTDQVVTRIYGHRGSMGKYPQNTILAMEKALEEGVQGLEFDVQMTKDGGLVIIHDEEISKLTTGSGMVRDLTLAEMSNFTTGGEKIPTLEEVLHLIKDEDIEINVELKTAIVEYKGIEEAVLKVVNDIKPKGKVVYSSFHLPTILRIKEIEPNAHIAFLLEVNISHPADYIETLDLDALHMNKDIVLKYKEHYRPIANKIRVYTVNEIEEIQELKEMGIAAVMTNFPERG